MKSMPEISRDFDGIAAAMRAAPRRDLLTTVEQSLLRHVPADAQTAIDVGCGNGRLARALAHRRISVLGIDASPGMIDLARVETDPSLGIEYRVADVMTDPISSGSFDVVTTISMVHHLPLDLIIPRLVLLVAPGGTLLVQDVTTRAGLRYFPSNVFAALISRTRRVIRGGDSRDVASLYEAHGTGEKYLTPSEAEREYRLLLPAARIENHMEWRYTVVWRRPSL